MTARICTLGLTTSEVDALVGIRRPQFDLWMHGQTIAICQTTDGPQACRGGHGVVTYASDVSRFLRGGEVVD